MPDENVVVVIVVGSIIEIPTGIENITVTVRPTILTEVNLSTASDQSNPMPSSINPFVLI